MVDGRMNIRQNASRFLINNHPTGIAAPPPKPACPFCFFSLKFAPLLALKFSHRVQHKVICHPTPNFSSDLVAIANKGGAL